MSAKKKKRSTQNQSNVSSAKQKPAHVPENSIAGEKQKNADPGLELKRTRNQHDSGMQVNESSSIDVTLGSKDTVLEGLDEGRGNRAELSTEEQAESVFAQKVIDEMRKPDNKKGKKGDWVGLFKDKRNNTQGFKLEKLDGNLEEDVMIDKEDLQDISKSFGSTLIGYVAGKSTGKLAIVQCCNIWLGKQQIIFHRSGWVVIRFDSVENRDRVLEEGPYSVYGRPFLLKPIPELFDFSHCQIRQVPVWVQLPNLPLEMWTERALSKISSRIGKPLNTDKLTRTMERICYARVLLEVDVAKALPLSISVRCPNGDTLNQEVIYEYVPYYCGGCKVIGHSDDRCPRNVKNKEKDPTIGKTGEEQEVMEPQEKEAVRVAKGVEKNRKSKEVPMKSHNATVSKQGMQEHKTEEEFTAVTRRKQKNRGTGGSKEVVIQEDSASSEETETEDIESGYTAVNNLNSRPNKTVKYSSMGDSGVHKFIPKK